VAHRVQRRRYPARQDVPQHVPGGLASGHRCPPDRAFQRQPRGHQPVPRAELRPHGPRLVDLRAARQCRSGQLRHGQDGDRRDGADHCEGKPAEGHHGQCHRAVAGCIPYALLIVSLVYGPPGGDPSQYGAEDRLDQSLAQLYAILFGVLLWIVIGILLRSAVRTGVPRWAAIATGILFPISAIAAFVAGAASFDLPGGWSILVPALLPPLIVLWAIWLRSPRLRPLVTVERASIAGLATVAIVCAATIPLNILDRLQMPARAAADARKNEAIAAQLAAERARRERAQRGKFASLTPESPFSDYLDYLNANLPEPEHEK